MLHKLGSPINALLSLNIRQTLGSSGYACAASGRDKLWEKHFKSSDKGLRNRQAEDTLSDFWPVDILLEVLA